MSPLTLHQIVERAGWQPALLFFVFTFTVFTFGYILGGGGKR